ncbi:MAG TPA: DNA polymerase IV [Thermoanaerobaculia bacterium]|nr:DNA polymerase IV [Thermoanaerobaculia bacterium]
MRKILHIDMDAFYAAVEQRDRPELRAKPVIVAWSDQPRSVVCAASYEARRYGVRSAMPAVRAKRLCPDGVFVRPDFIRYRAVSLQVRAILLRHTALVEPLSLDEAYLDVTEEATGLPSATETARVIRDEIRAATGLTASAGAAPNKFLAKIASDWRKPDGLFVIKPAQVDRFLAPLPVRRLPGVGGASERILAGHGITTVGELRQRERVDLRFLFGRFGDRLWELARGIDEHPVVPDQPAKQISSETTFERDVEALEVAAHLAAAAREVWEEAARRHRQPRTVTVKLRTPDFSTRTRSSTPTRSPSSAEEVAQLAVDLLPRFGFPPQARFRLAGVGVSNFLDEDLPAQGRLF